MKFEKKEKGWILEELEDKKCDPTLDQAVEEVEEEIKKREKEMNKRFEPARKMALKTKGEDREEKAKVHEEFAKDRKELSTIINRLKEQNIKFVVKKSLDESYRYQVLYEDAASILSHKLSKILMPQEPKKRLKKWWEVYWYEAEDENGNWIGDPIYKKFSTEKAANKWYSEHCNDADKFGMASPWGYVDESLKEDLLVLKEPEKVIKESFASNGNWKVKVYDITWNDFKDSDAEYELGIEKDDPEYREKVDAWKKAELEKLPKEVEIEINPDEIDDDIDSVSDLEYYAEEEIWKKYDYYPKKYKVEVLEQPEITIPDGFMKFEGYPTEVGEVGRELITKDGEHIWITDYTEDDSGFWASRSKSDVETGRGRFWDRDRILFVSEHVNESLKEDLPDAIPEEPIVISTEETPVEEQPTEEQVESAVYLALSAELRDTLLDIENLKSLLVTLIEEENQESVVETINKIIEDRTAHANLLRKELGIEEEPEEEKSEEEVEEDSLDELEEE